jgi:hypothetical protein
MNSLPLLRLHSAKTSCAGWAPGWWPGTPERPTQLSVVATNFGSSWCSRSNCRNS